VCLYFLVFPCISLPSLQGAFGRLDPTGEAAEMMMATIPEGRSVQPALVQSLAVGSFHWTAVQDG
jgi:hypothetical protein